ncbi:DUF308 domain-containing protein [Mycetocola spongiae]|uniref:DUF308 domain-containing protein n=1 Tax=Mycetocola spongiae TaxID=2859226 RepID=UPI001CF17426|nr:DUF308 domain-containing protein [Mycetocola spongiae]UCR88290.1 hypothetical protein KXZ72_09905 [Mycetocola spongiae]
MATPVDAAPPGAVAPVLPRSSWTLPIARAIVAAVVALVITFSSDHSALFGLYTFGGFAVLEGLVLLIFSGRALPRVISGGLFRLQGIVGVVLGAAALILAATLPDARLVAYLGLVIAWALLSGVLELVSGLRARGRVEGARDWLTIGGLTLLLALVFVLVRPEFNHPYGGDGKVPPGVLTASIMGVGLFGAYAAISAVFQGIAGLSLRWAGTAKTADRVTEGV